MARYEQIQLRRDSTLNWQASNPRLALGEIGIDMDLKRFKVGNGIDGWNELPYFDENIHEKIDGNEKEIAEAVKKLREQLETDKADLQVQVTNNKTGINNTNTRIDEITSRQKEYEADLNIQIEREKSKIQEELDTFNRTRDTLNLRMDVIAGQATEDTEILDARIDAENTVHTNLGHNVRAIHAKTLKNAKDIQGLSSGVQAINLDIDGLSEKDKSLERDISLTRDGSNARDEYLQEQTDVLANAFIEDSRRNFNNANEFRENIESLTQKSESLQSQADTLSEKQEITSQALEHEHARRIEREDYLQEQSNDLAEGILNLVRETYRHYAEGKTALQRELARRDEELERQREQIQHIANAALMLVGIIKDTRDIKADKTLAAQIEARLSVIEYALTEGGLLVPSETPPKTDDEIDALIDDALAGVIKDDSDYTDDSDDDREYYEQLDEIFSGESEPNNENDDESDEEDAEFNDELDNVFNTP